ncbi:hypothetical protein HPB50_026059 [Hyalomma asiaticum]|uniref:Uncharacterized protein n=1 Tax=Hyalomma asiaticum TaxID=266040 RepID=A0ACB7SI24_HYAAI|nr:hypothetical protein HPB50_026059 [Hyalomma asiaticum]
MVSTLFGQEALPLSTWKYSMNATKNHPEFRFVVIPKKLTKPASTAISQRPSTLFVTFSIIAAGMEKALQKADPGRRPTPSLLKNCAGLRRAAKHRKGQRRLFCPFFAALLRRSITSRRALIGLGT